MPVQNRQEHQDQKNRDHYVFTGSQVMSLITSSIIGVGVLTLPRTVTEKAHQSGWISVILGGLIGVVGLWFILKIAQRFQGKGFISMAQEVLGSAKHPVVGKILIFPIILVFILYWLVTTAGVARTFGEVVVTAVLIRTPLEVVVGSMLLVAFTLVLYDIEVMARVNEALLPIMIIPVLFIAILSFQAADFTRLLPLMSVDWKGILLGTLAAAFTYQGYEILLLFMGNLPPDAKKTTMAAMWGLAVPVLVYVLIVVAGISSFGYEELQKLMWPTLELVKTTEMPGLILERLESAFLGVWVAAVFTTVANFFFTACHTVKSMFGLKTHRYVALVALPALYFMAMWPGNVHQLFLYLDKAAWVGLGLGNLVPMLLLLGAIMRKKGQNKWGSKAS